MIATASSSELIAELYKAAKGNDLLSITIRKAITDKASDTDILEMVKRQANDNPPMMYSVLGFNLTRKIMNV